MSIAAVFTAAQNAIAGSFGQTGSIYSPNSAVLSDSNLVPSAYTLAGTIMGVSITASSEATMSLTAMGIMGANGYDAYFNAADMPNLQIHSCIATVSGQVFIVAAKPVPQIAGDAVHSVYCLLREIDRLPTGVILP